MDDLSSHEKTSNDNSSQDLTTLAFKELKVSLTALSCNIPLTTLSQTCSVIYISTDTDPEAPKRVAANVPWLKMVFADNSDFAPMVKYSESAKIVEIEDVARGEDFIQAGVSARSSATRLMHLPFHSLL